MTAAPTATATAGDEVERRDEPVAALPADERLVGTIRSERSATTGWKWESEVAIGDRSGEVRPEFQHVDRGRLHRWFEDLEAALAPVGTPAEAGVSLRVSASLM